MMHMHLWSRARRYIKADDLKVQEGYLEHEMNRGAKRFWEARGKRPPFVESSRVEDMRGFYAWAAHMLNWHPVKRKSAGVAR